VKDPDPGIRNQKTLVKDRAQFGPLVLDSPGSVFEPHVVVTDCVLQLFVFPQVEVYVKWIISPIEICVFMNGKVFSPRSTWDLFSPILMSSDPYIVK
jgi:hypothetical protein